MYCLPPKNFAQVLSSVLVVRDYKVYDVQYEMVNMKTRASGLTLKKRPKGYSEMERYFSRSTLQAALFPQGDWLSCTLP